VTALAALRARPPVDAFDTHLSEQPVWFSFATTRRTGADDVIEFPSRHAVDVSCWDGGTLQALGSASRDSDSGGPLQAAKAGFALRLQPLPAQLVCRARFVGPAHLTVRQWTRDESD